MRLQLTVQRQSLPPVRVLWTAGATRPTSNAASASYTVSQFLEQVNEIIPLEADDWGLEDYAVEVRGFECLHFSELNQVLKEDDEVCIRPLQTSDLRFRRISGRHQISSDGRHLIDGVAFGRPFLRRSERPPIRIPPRKRRRVIYDEEDDGDNAGSQAIVPPGFYDDVNAWAEDEDDAEDDEYADNDLEEEDLAAELQDIKSDIRKMTDQDGAIPLEVTDGAQDADGAIENSKRLTRSQRVTEGLGLQGPALLKLLDENGRPFPGVYSNPLLDFFSQEDPPGAHESPRRKRRKTNGIIDVDQGDKHTAGPSSGVLVPRGRRESSASIKSVRFQDEPPVTPPTTVLERHDSENTEDEDFEPPGNEEDEVDESDKENAEPRMGEISNDRMSSDSDTSSSDLSESDTDSDDTSSSGSSTSSSSSSDTEINTASDASSDLQAGEEESSSSTSSSSSSSDSDDDTRTNTKDSTISPTNAKSKKNSAQPFKEIQQKSAVRMRPDKIQPSKKALRTATNDTQQTALAKTKLSNSRLQGVPPGQGMSVTQARNKRRRSAQKIRRMQASGEYPDDEAKSIVADRYASKEPVTEETEDTETADRKAAAAANYEFETRRNALLESIASGGVAVLSPSTTEVEKTARTKPIRNLPDDAPKKPVTLQASNKVAGEVAQPSHFEAVSTEALVKPDETRKVEGLFSTRIHDPPGAVAEEKPASTEHSAADEPPSVKASKPRSKIDLASSKRMLFGALGLRTPKNKEEEKALQDKLMKDIRPTKKAPTETVAAAQEATAEVNLGYDESWRDKIDLRAVECCYEGIQLSTPPFPFVQRWDPQQQRGYDPRGKKRKRNNLRTYDPFMTEHGMGKAAKHMRFDSDPDENADAKGLEWTAALQESQVQENQHEIDREITQESRDIIADTTGNYTEDLPALPQDLDSCATLTEESCKPGTVIAFKQLDMSQATKWQPQISKYKTAIIDQPMDDGTLRVTLAHRDRPNQEELYDPETGERIYHKFEMPGYDNQEEGGSDFFGIPFKEMIEPIIIRRPESAQVEEGEQVMSMPSKTGMSAATTNDDTTLDEAMEMIPNSQDDQADNVVDESWEGIEDTVAAEDMVMTETCILEDLAHANGLDHVKCPDLSANLETTSELAHRVPENVADRMAGNTADETTDGVADRTATEIADGMADEIVDSMAAVEPEPSFVLAQDRGSDQVEYPDLSAKVEARGLAHRIAGDIGNRIADDTVMADKMAEEIDEPDPPLEPLPSQFDVTATANGQPSEQKNKKISEEVRDEISKLIRDAGWRSSLNPEVGREKVVRSDSSPLNEKMDELIHVRSSEPNSPRFHGFNSDPCLEAEDEGEELPAEISETVQEPAEVPDSMKDPPPGLSSPRQDHAVSHDAPDEWAPATLDEDDSRLWDTQANQQILSEGTSSHLSTPRAPRPKAVSHASSSRIAKSISPPRLSKSKDSPRISSTAPERNHNLNGIKKDGKSNRKASDSGSSSDEFPSLEKVFAARIASLDHPSSSIPPQKIKSKAKKHAADDEEIKSEDSSPDMSALPRYSTQNSTQNTQKKHTQKRARATPIDDSSLQYISDNDTGFVLGSQIPEGSQIIDLTLSSDPVEPSDSAYEGDSSLPTGPGWMEKVRKSARERSMGKGEGMQRKGNGGVRMVGR